jgi:hypothetical protein
MRTVYLEDIEDVLTLLIRQKQKKNKRLNQLIENMEFSYTRKRKSVLEARKHEVLTAVLLSTQVF